MENSSDILNKYPWPQAWTVARAMAREPWSREYFDRLKAAHQNHYEQFGDVRGVIEVDGEEYQLDVQVRI